MNQLPKPPASDAMLSTASSAARRPRNREATIRSVLESAQRLFGTKGYDNTSLVDIAAETGLSPRGVILHFSSKADIAAELMFRDLRERAESFREGDGTSSAPERIEAFFIWLAECDGKTFLNFPALWGFAARWAPTTEVVVQETIEALLAPVRRAVEEGVARGEVRAVDPAIACEVLWTSYVAGLRRAAIHNGRPADAVPYVKRTIELLRP